MTQSCTRQTMGNVAERGKNNKMAERNGETDEVVKARIKNCARIDDKRCMRAGVGVIFP